MSITTLPLCPYKVRRISSQSKDTDDKKVHCHFVSDGVGSGKGSVEKKTLSSKRVGSGVMSKNKVGGCLMVMDSI